MFHETFLVAVSLHGRNFTLEANKSIRRPVFIYLSKYPKKNQLGSVVDIAKHKQPWLDRSFTL